MCGHWHCADRTTPRAPIILFVFLLSFHFADIYFCRRSTFFSIRLTETAFRVCSKSRKTHVNLMRPIESCHVSLYMRRVRIWKRVRRRATGATVATFTTIAAQLFIRLFLFIRFILSFIVLESQFGIALSHTPISHWMLCEQILLSW